MSEFSDFLHKKYIEKCKNQKLSIRSLSKKIGMSHNYLGQILHGKVNAPKANIQKKLADELIEINERKIFFNLAAKDRKEVPIDIFEKASKEANKWSKLREILEEGEKEK